MTKKRLLAIVLSIIMVFSYAVPAFGEEIPGSADGNEITEQTGETVDASKWTAEDFTYGSYEKLLYGCDYTRQITIKGTAVTGLSQSGETKLEDNKALVIPAEDDEGDPIVGVAESAFQTNNLTSIILPDTVTSLGGGAFGTNPKLERINLSKGLTEIPRGAFSMNIRLEKIIIPDTVTEIGATAFAGARLTELTIPESVTKIGEKAFHLHHLKELTIPGNVKEIGDSAFEGTYKATTLRKLTIEEGVEVIGSRAFKEALLETVRFPDSIKTVGTAPFLNNSGKDGTHVVEVITENPEHTKFKDDTYEIKLIGKDNVNDNEDTAKPENDKAEASANTGEDSNMLPWAVLMAIAMVGIGATALRRRRRG